MIMKIRSEGTGCLGTAFLILIAGVISFLISMWLLPYSVNTVQMFLSKPKTDISPWVAGFLGVIPGVSELIIPIAIGVWILDMFI